MRRAVVLFVCLAVAFVWGMSAATSAAVVTKPDPVLTPGAQDPAVTQATLATTICAAGYAKTVPAVSSATKTKVFSEYHVKKAARSKYVIDHLVPVELGGSNAIPNLWPQPRRGTNTAAQKDSVEASLQSQVCQSLVPLNVAQQGIVSDWTSAVATVTTPAPRTAVQWFYYGLFMRFAAPVVNPGPRPVDGVQVTWTAYDASGAIVGSHTTSLPTIDAGSTWPYVGGAGVQLTGTPTRVEVKISNTGHYVAVAPAPFVVDSIDFKPSSNISPNASNYEVNANVTITGTAQVPTSALTIVIVLKDASGAIVGGNFDVPTNLPATLNPGTKFHVDNRTVTATAVPATALVAAARAPL